MDMLRDRFGVSEGRAWRRAHKQLRLEGRQINAKRVQRLSGAEGPKALCTERFDNTSDGRALKLNVVDEVGVVVSLALLAIGYVCSRRTPVSVRWRRFRPMINSTIDP